MKEKLIQLLSKEAGLSPKEVESLLEIPPSPELGDFAFPCFSLAKTLKKSPVQIAQELSEKISSKELEKVEAKGPYINFFLDKKKLFDETINKILKEKDKYGSSSVGKGKTIVIDMSSPNIAKPFGIGHLRSTIIGNAIGNISKAQGYKVVKLNYLGDWGTPFGKIIEGYKKWGDAKKLEKEPIKHLYEIYVKASQDSEMEEAGRQTFKKLEEGDKETSTLWKKFRQLSVREFNKLYKTLGISFDVTSSESEYNNKMQFTLNELKEKNLLVKDQGALVVKLDKYNLGTCLIQKSDGATLYATRDITAAIDRYKKYKFSHLLYEVGQEQKLHFKQFFKILELLGYSWAKNCVHIEHGLYLGKDGKKFATRKGKTVFMEDIIEETKELAKREIAKREKLSSKQLDERALKIALAAIFYGDLKNHRSGDIVFDLQRFLSFEGNTGPYLLYSYVRACSILRKAKSKTAKVSIQALSEKEKKLVTKLGAFPDVVKISYEQLAPNMVANYAFELAQAFNEFYHAEQVIGSEQEGFRLILVRAFTQTLKNSLNLLGIEALEQM
ncbi:arginine--tRNA ligase [Candidatus Pacearchaeota archaeon]|nr:arginine--tRNA ligase [Candidatus Pacearchaeota archaeon]